MLIPPPPPCIVFADINTAPCIRKCLPRTFPLVGPPTNHTGGGRPPLLFPPSSPTNTFGHTHTHTKHQTIKNVKKKPQILTFLHHEAAPPRGAARPSVSQPASGLSLSRAGGREVSLRPAGRWVLRQNLDFLGVSSPPLGGFAQARGDLVACSLLTPQDEANGDGGACDL